MLMWNRIQVISKVTNRDVKCYQIFLLTFNLIFPCLICMQCDLKLVQTGAEKL